jgi:RNA polymerase sigma factor (sigma-70 family)
MESASDNASHTLSAALDGDKVAQQIVFSQYYDLIDSVASEAWPSELRHVITHEDLTQKILVRILEKLDTVDRSQLVAFPGWVKKVARSVVLDEERHWRAYDHGRVHFLAAGIDSGRFDIVELFRIVHSLPEEPVCRDEAKTALLSCMEHLPHDQKEAIHRKYYLDEAHDEIAAAMNRSTGAVRELLRRARAKMEELMGTQSHWLSSR